MKVASKKKVVKKKVAAKPGKVAPEAAKEVKKPEKKEEEKFEPSKLVDRDVLVASARELRIEGKLEAMRVPDLRRLVHEGLVKAASGKFDVSSIKGDALATLLEKSGCIGVFVDVRTADCASCVDQAECVKMYLGNLREDFSSVIGRAEVAQEVEKKEEVPERKNKPEQLELPKTEPLWKKEVEKFDANKIFVVFEVRNPVPPGTVEHAFVRAVLKLDTTTLAELAPVYGRYRGDGLKIDTFAAAIEYLKGIGVGCYPEELPDEVKRGLTDEERELLGIAVKKKKKGQEKK